MILSSYEESCNLKGITNQVLTKTKNENLLPTYPSHYQLIANCKMKPSQSHYYRVKDLRLDKVVVFLIKSYKLYLMDAELVNLMSLSKTYHEMINNVLRLQSVNFSSLKQPRLGYADQAAISHK